MDFAAFCGWRYDFERVGPPESVLAPPYDVISHDEAARMRALSPYHVIHLILGKPAPGSSFKPEDYRQAAATWSQWRREGVLVREEKPALYTYDITFDDLVTGVTHTRRGVLGSLKLVPFEEGVVRPHEEIFPGPLSDRTQLLEAADAVFSPIFGLYEDPSDAARAILEEANPTPLLECEDADGCIHRVCRITDPRALAAFSEAVADSPVILADGHHRYTAALEYARRRGRLGGDGPGARTLACLSTVTDPGLRAYGTHRLFSHAPGLDLAVLRDVADLTPLGDRSPKEALEVMAASAVPAYVFATAQGLTLVSIENPAGLERLLASVHPVLRTERLTMLHRGILPLLGLSAERLDEVGGVSHSRDAEEAVDRVRRGEYDLAILVQAPEGDEVARVCAGGQRMPHKSTYFYPKLLSGCLFYDLAAGCEQ